MTIAGIPSEICLGGDVSLDQITQGNFTRVLNGVPILTNARTTVQSGMVHNVHIVFSRLMDLFFPEKSGFVYFAPSESFVAKHYFFDMCTNRMVWRCDPIEHELSPVLSKWRVGKNVSYLVADYDKGSVDESVWRLIYANPQTVFISSKSPDLLSKIKNYDLSSTCLVLNQYEFRDMFPNLEGMEECDRIKDNLGAVVVTRGENSTLILLDRVYELDPPEPVEKVDPIGAGDVFFAAFSFFVLFWPCLKESMPKLGDVGNPESQRFLAAASWAQKLSTHSVTQVGSWHPTEKQVKDVLF